MRILNSIAFFILLPYFAFGQVNMELQANITYDQKLSDIWGYTDSLGREYALVCLQAGIAIEDISNPTEPKNVAIIEGPSSTWRDAKTFGQFAYFINESSGGLQIINLKNLPNAPDSTDSYFWTPLIPELGLLSTCHNIYIDEATGYGFLAGCNLNNGGVLVIDLFTDPGNPIYVSSAAVLLFKICVIRIVFLQLVLKQRLSPSHIMLGCLMTVRSSLQQMKEEMPQLVLMIFQI